MRTIIQKMRADVRMLCVALFAASLSGNNALRCRQNIAMRMQCRNLRPHAEKTEGLRNGNVRKQVARNLARATISNRHEIVVDTSKNGQKNNK